MASPAQFAANLANAHHSTGPVTEDGKATSAQNSLKHGLTAQTVLLPGEDPAAYRALCDGIFQTFDPTQEPEKQLIQQLCDTQWRLHRCARLEATILSAGAPDFKSLDSISKHEARLKKQYSATLKEATALIEARLAREEAEMKQAMLVRRADKIDGCGADLEGFGFVFSLEEVDIAIAREDGLQLAREVLTANRMARRGYAPVRNQ